MTGAACFSCGRAGHWAKDCDTAPCPKCRVGMHLHTQLGVIECAWRGEPCAGCGQPAHPDGAPARCGQYEHPSDSRRDRKIRAVTAWVRDADPDSLYRRPARA